RRRYADQKTELERLRALVGANGHGQAAAHGNGRTRKDPGRPEGTLSKDTERRRRFAAALSFLKWTERKQAPLLYRETPDTAYQNTKTFYSRNRREIQALMSTMTADLANAILASEGYRNS